MLGLQFIIRDRMSLVTPPNSKGSLVDASTKTFPSSPSSSRSMQKDLRDRLAMVEVWLVLVPLTYGFCNSCKNRRIVSDLDDWILSHTVQQNTRYNNYRHILTVGWWVENFFKLPAPQCHKCRAGETALAKIRILRKRCNRQSGTKDTTWILSFLSETGFNFHFPIFGYIFKISHPDQV